MAVDKLVDSTQLDSDLTSIANAIRTKGGTSESLSFPSGFVSAIGDITTGGVIIHDTQDTAGGTVREITAVNAVYSGINDVMFYDYNGAVVAAYTKEEFASLTAMPDVPAHDGLTSQGWNWTLANAKTAVASCGMLDIGATYVTSDGKTRLYIVVDDITRPELPLHWKQSVANSVSVDWGDGSTAETVSGTGGVSLTHTYAAAGAYTVTMTCSSGNMSLGDGTNCVVGSPTAYHNTAKLRKVFHGSNVNTINGAAFYGCRRLQHITIPTTVGSIGSAGFAGCQSLEHITYPSGMTSTGTTVYDSAMSLRSISMSETFTTCGRNNHQYNTALRRIASPNVDFGSTVFSNCYSLKYVVISRRNSLISSNTYVNCYNINELYLPDNIVNIGSGVFKNNSCVTKVRLSANLAYIGESMFEGCGSLASIEIPATVANVYSKGFYNCTGMKEIHFKSTTVPALANNNAFEGTASDLVIYVPSAKLSDYQAAWPTYASRMVGE